MKKVLAMVLVAVMLSALALTLVACSPAGTYKFDSVTMSYGAINYEYKAGEKIQGVSIDENAIILELNKDGTYVFTSTFPGYEIEEEGTWEKDGKKIVFDDGEFEATIDGKTLTLEMDEGMHMVIVLKK